MTSRTVHPDSSAEFYTDERCFILESWNSDDDPELSVARARVTARREHSMARG